jgi:hypothetical protein
MPTDSINKQARASHLRRHQMIAVIGKQAYAVISGVENIDGDICVTVYENGIPGTHPMYVFKPSDAVVVCQLIAQTPPGVAVPSVEEWPPRCIDALPKVVGARVRHLDHLPVGRKNPKSPDVGTGRIADYLSDEDRYVVEWDNDAPSKPNPVAWSDMIGSEDPDFGNWGA